MPDRDITGQVSDAMETLEEFTGANVKKLTAGTTAEAYRQAAIAAVTALPLTLGAVGPVPAISQAQEPVKRPEEHLPSQSQEANTVGGAGFIVVATSTSSDGFSIVNRAGMKTYFNIPSKPKPPQS